MTETLEKLLNFLKSLKKLYPRLYEDLDIAELTRMSEKGDFSTLGTCQCGKLLAEKFGSSWQFLDSEYHTCEPPDIIKDSRALRNRQLKRQEIAGGSS